MSKKTSERANKLKNALCELIVVLREVLLSVTPSMEEVSCRNRSMRNSYEDVAVVASSKTLLENGYVMVSVRTFPEL